MVETRMHGYLSLFIISLVTVSALKMTLVLISRVLVQCGVLLLVTQIIGETFTFGNLKACEMQLLCKECFNGQPYWREDGVSID